MSLIGIAGCVTSLLLLLLLLWLLSGTRHVARTVAALVAVPAAVMFVKVVQIPPSLERRLAVSVLRTGKRC